MRDGWRWGRRRGSWSKIPGAAADVEGAKRTLDEAQEKMAKWKGISRRKSTTMGLVIGIGKELMALFEE
jgi:hypothetical protein